MPITFTVTAIRSQGNLVLFDSGTGGQLMPTAGLIVRNDLWTAAGIDPAKVTTIVITHFHPDHIIGLMAKDTNAPIFPNAEIHIAAAEYKFWTDPAITGGAAKRIQAVFPAGRTSSSSKATRKWLAGVRPGHPLATPGHTSYLVSDRAAAR